MKKLILLVATLISTQVHAACASGGDEAQAFVTVQAASQNADQQCVVNLKVDWSRGEMAYRENPNCPLDSAVVENSNLIAPVKIVSSAGDTACSWKAGDALSGVLVLKQGRIEIE